MGLEEKKQVPFRGTAEQERQLLDFIEEHKQVGGCLMPIMQKAQEIYGYLPEEVQKMIADAMGIPMEEVYGVSTFYSQFHLMPKGKYEISVCLGTACYVKGAEDIYNKFMEQLGIVGRRVHAGRKVFSGCLSMCRRLWTGTGGSRKR